MPPEANFEKARELLDEAGLSNVNLTLDVLNKTTNVSAAQIIQATLANVGINLEINLHESGAFWSLGDEAEGERYKDIQLILNRFSMTPDPYYATSWFTTEQVGVWNWERFSDEEFDRLHEQAKSEADLEKRAEMYQRMQDIMEETGAYRFITHEVNPVIYRNTIDPALSERMGLDDPLPVQIVGFFGNLLQGDMGVDVFSNRPVTTIVFEQLPYALVLIGVGVGWAVLLGVPLGSYSALHRASWLDKVVAVLSVSAIAVPSFVVALYALLANHWVWWASSWRSRWCCLRYSPRHSPPTTPSA